MESVRAIRLLRELVQTRQWEQVREQMDLLHVDAVARALSGLEHPLLRMAFATLPYHRRSAVFAHMAQQDQDVVLKAVGPDRARRIVRGLRPEDRRALLRAMPRQAGEALSAA